MAVNDYMTGFLEIKHDLSVREAAAIMDKREARSALILKNGKPVGIITERDFLRKVVAKGLNPAELKVEDITSSPIITIGMNAKVKDASLLMDKNNIRRLAVVNEKGEIVGKITVDDISRSLGFQKLKKTFTDKPRDYYLESFR